MPHHGISGLAALVLLSGCVSDPVPSESYPFVGRWDCQVAEFTFTNTTYNNGSETLPIRSIEQDGGSYTLRFDGGYVVALAAVTETGMTWVSGTSGDQFTCVRLQ
jgi:hypothetical protein